VNASKNFDFQLADDRALLWKAIIKAADVSNVSKTWDIYQLWIERLTEEFFRQGDKERELGMQISPFMDRSAKAIPHSQINFMDFITLPLFETLSKVLKVAEPCIVALLKNRETMLFLKDNSPNLEPVIEVDQQNLNLDQKKSMEVVVIPKISQNSSTHSSQPDSKLYNQSLINNNRSNKIQQHNRAKPNFISSAFSGSAEMLGTRASRFSGKVGIESQSSLNFIETSHETPGANTRGSYAPNLFMSNSVTNSQAARRESLMDMIQNT
ncbi:cAMP-specific 3',5'-cyclic phosphodiesterase 4D, partial [Nowakowskiella sp. JEL0078]